MKSRSTWKTRAAAIATALALGVVAPVGPTTPASAAEDVLMEWLSADATGAGGRELSALSDDGRFGIFVGRSGEAQGVWLVDRKLDLTTRLTTGSHVNPDISGDGRYITYVEYSSTRPVYILDRITGQRELVSVASDEKPADGLSDYPSLSYDGRYVAFQSMDEALDPNVTGVSGGGPNKAYVRDRVAGTTEMVSVSDTGEMAKGQGLKPDISSDGRYVAFASDATNLVSASAPAAEEEEEEEEAVQHVYRRDRQAKTTIMVSVSGDGTPGDAGSSLAYGPSISGDGSKVAFESDATNLVGAGADNNNDTDAFVRDVAAGTTVMVSTDVNGNQGDLPNPEVEEPVDPEVPDGGGGGGGGDETGADLTPNVGVGPVISRDGKVVAFESQAPLTPDDVNAFEVTVEEVTETVYVVDIYLRTLGGALERASVAGAGGVEATGMRTDGMGETAPAINGADPAINADGRYVSFTSMGNLAGDRPPPEEEGEEEPTEEEPVEVQAWEPGIYARTMYLPVITWMEPTSIARGRNFQTVTIDGYGFTAPSSLSGIEVDLGAGITVHSATWLASDRIEAVVSVAWDAPLGNRVLKVTNPAGDSAVWIPGAAADGSEVAGLLIMRRGTGYRLVASDGGVFTYGTSTFLGSTGDIKLNQPIVGATNTPSGKGYWLVARDGGIFAFGDAGFYGSTGDIKLNQPVVGMAATPSGKGYWLVARDGGIFAFGDAAFYGSTGAMTLNQPVVGMAPTPSGKGYWFVARDGGIFAFGDGGFYGSTGDIKLNQPVVGMAAAPSGKGYWFVARDGGIFAFGAAPFLGSTGAIALNKPVVGMASNPGGLGYWFVASDGGVFGFGEDGFFGSAAEIPLNHPIVALTVD